MKNLYIYYCRTLYIEIHIQNNIASLFASFPKTGIVTHIIDKYIGMKTKI